MMPDDDLLPCPFCGGKVEFEPDENLECSYIGCRNEGCSAMPTIVASTPPRATKVWNTRAATPVNAALLEALESCLSLVRLKFGNTDRTGNAVIEQAETAIAQVKGE